MRIVDYLSEIEFAASNVISTIWAERNRIEELLAEIKSLSVAVEANYQRALALQESDDIDDVAMGAGVYWENYFGDDKQLFHKNEEALSLEGQLALHEFSIASLSGNLLHYAKQGISICHGELRNCPDGRMIGTQPLKAVMWQGRNQALHWEAGTFHPPVERCFQALATDIDSKFNDYLNRNMAFDVVEFLGWKDFNAFETDMLSIQ
jgi:hypothetical protein